MEWEAPQNVLTREVSPLQEQIFHGGGGGAIILVSAYKYGQE